MPYTINYNKKENHIDVISIDFSAEDAPGYLKDFENIMKQVSPKFTGTTDVTESKKVLTPEVAAMLAPTGSMASAAGQAGWAYVTNNPIWKMQLKRIFGRDFADAYESYEEARTHLKSLQ
jgi:hypothetical protein